MTRRVLAIGGALLVLAAGLGYVRWWLPTRAAVAVGTAMLAKQMCSCLFVAGRSEGECRADQFASMDAISLEVGRDPGRVRAFVPLLGERSATFSKELGCTLR